ncbi:MAG: prolipoprotein diacylglyceryl transferase [Clostridia bacterium]|nr:prolipoprotein diacylglyceryl transferase [Clostridia bacterium]
MYPDPLISIAGSGIFWLYDLFLLIGVFCAIILCDIMGAKRGFSARLQLVVLVSTVLCVVVGYWFATLFQAFYNFRANPDAGFHLDENTGATFYGGLIGGAATFLACYFFLGKRYVKNGEAIKKIPDMLSIAACCIPLGHGFGRLGCLMAGCCHGKPTDAWYGIYMKELGVKVVPVQLFESIVLFLIAAVFLYLFFTGRDKKLPLFGVYCMVYGVWRFFIEFARGDDRGATIVSVFSPSQLIAVVLVTFGIGYLVAWAIYRKKKKEQVDSGTENLSDQA